MSGFAFIVKWAMLVLLLIVLAKNEIGNRLIYYFLWLSVLILLVTHASELTAAFQGKETP